MMSEDGSSHEITELGARWAQAELRGDAGSLRELLDPGFEAVGPLGYVLDRDAWLARHEDAALDYERFGWDHAAPRVHGDAAIVVGIQSAAARHEGEVVSGSYRATLVWLRARGSWRIASLHLTEIPSAHGQA